MTHLVSEPFESYGGVNSSTLFKPPSRPSQFIGSTTMKAFGQLNKNQVSIVQKLLNFKELNENWDSYGAKKPSTTAIDRAIYFIEYYSHLNLPYYFTSPGVNGEVMVEFSEGSRAAEIYFNVETANELLLFENDEVIFEGHLDGNIQKLADFFNP